MIKKQTLAFLMLILILMNDQGSVYASQAPVEPYVLSRQINAQPVDSSTCLILLKGENQTSDSSDQAQRLTDNQNQLAEMASQFQVINQAIQDLETGQADSLDALQEGLDWRIEEVYQSYLDQDEGFVNLSEEDQMAWIQEDSQVQEFQVAIDQVQAEINQWVNERAVLEEDYQALIYENDQIQADLDKEEEFLAQLNQCQLYPYSTQPLHLEEVLLNSQPSDLNQLFVQLDSYLEQIIPLAYRKLSYEDIYQQFNQLKTYDQIQSQLDGKANLELDESAFDVYSYAKELSLFDVQVLAAMAMKHYQNDGDMNRYQQAYQQVVALKDQQFNYFYQINDQIFENFKTLLRDFLNDQHLVTEADQEAVASFHQRYQVQLVQYDEVSQTWQSLPGQKAGYPDLYSQKDLLQEEIEPEATSTSQDQVETTLLEEEITTSQEPLDLVESSLEDTDALNSSSDQLAKLKDKLNTKRNGSSRSNKNLPTTTPKRSPLSKNANSKGLKEKTSSGKSPLPSTGEQQFYLILATILLVVGLIPLTIKIYRRRKHRRALQDQGTEKP